MPGRPNDRVLLNDWTRRFIDGSPKLLYTEVVTRLYPDGTSDQLPPRPVHGPAEKPVAEPCGERFAAIYPLYRYTFGDGREYREIVQVVATEADGTTVYLLGLEDAAGKWVIDSFWSAADVAAKRLTVLRNCVT